MSDREEATGPQLFLAGFGSLFLLAGIFFLGTAMYEAGGWWDEKSWVATELEIESARSVQEFDGGRPYMNKTVDYSYSFEGQAFRGTTQALGRYTIEELNDLRRQGSPAQGRVSPIDPTQSILEPATLNARLTAALLLLLIGSGSGGVGLLMVIQGGKALKRIRKRSLTTESRLNGSHEA